MKRDISHLTPIFAIRTLREDADARGLRDLAQAYERALLRMVEEREALWRRSRSDG